MQPPIYKNISRKGCDTLKKRIISLLLALAMILSTGMILSACNKEPSEDTSETSEEERIEINPGTEITVWGAFGSDYWEHWKRDYPDVKLNNTISSDASLLTLAAAMNAGKQPDMYYTNNAASAPLGAAVMQRMVIPLDDYLAKDKDYKLSDLPSWYDMFVKYPDPDTGEEHIYAVYTDVSVACLVWNKKLFEQAGLDPDKPPKTWNEMYEYAQKLTKRDSSGMVIQAGFTNYRWWFQHWRLTYGTQYQDPVTGKPNFNTPEMINVMNFLKKFPSIYGGTDKMAEGVSWENQTVAMEIADVGYYQKMRNDFEIGLAPLPSPDDYTGEQVVAGYAWQWYGIPKGAKNPDGGWVFARWAVTEGVSGVMEREANDAAEKFVPVYMAHKPSKQKILDKYSDGLREDIREIIQVREEIYDKISIQRPCGGPINAKWDKDLESICCEIIDGTKTVTDGINEIQEKGMAYYNEFYADLGKPAP